MYNQNHVYYILNTYVVNDIKSQTVQGSRADLAPQAYFSINAIYPIYKTSMPCALYLVEYADRTRIYPELRRISIPKCIDVLISIPLR